MKIREARLGSAPFWEVDEWRSRGIVNGFFAADFDTKISAGEDLARALEIEWQSPNLRILQLEQTHSADFVELLSEAQWQSFLLNPDSRKNPADALLADFSRLDSAAQCALGIRTADCIPVLISVRGSSLAAALHCGWRGADAGLLLKVLDRIERLGFAKSSVEIALGPGAGECCFEIGADVEKILADNWLELIAQFPIIIRREARIFCSITGLLKAQAVSWGISGSQIIECSLCTICDFRFFSFRRQKALSGRQLSIIGSSSVS